MVAANGAMARFLDGRGVSSIRRVVKAPERWQRIVALASRCGHSLPPEPSSRALAAFLEERKVAEPDTFADLSLSVVKLMGPGEYALERPGEPHDGHFGLAVADYSHSTAPNRRFADLVTQRLLKAALAGAPAPYTDEELAAIAARSTQKENDARKVERTTRKQAAAVFLSGRIGHEFEGIVTGWIPPRRVGSCAGRRGSTWAIGSASGSSRPNRARGSSTSSGRASRRRAAAEPDTHIHDLAGEKASLAVPGRSACWRRNIVPTGRHAFSIEGRTEGSRPMKKTAPTTAPQQTHSNRTTTARAGIAIKTNVRAGFTPVPIPSPRLGGGG
jgi:hypothetical protein